MLILSAETLVAKIILLALGQYCKQGLAYSDSQLNTCFRDRPCLIFCCVLPVARALAVACLPTFNKGSFSWYFPPLSLPCARSCASNLVMGWAHIKDLVPRAPAICLQHTTPYDLFITKQCLEGSVQLCMIYIRHPLYLDFFLSLEYSLCNKALSLLDHSTANPWH
jgi:hypothetical protein